MYADRERANQVIEYMKRVNEEWVRYGVQSKAAALTDPRARYSFHKFLYEKNLFVNGQERNSDVWIECPFHEDASPSCSISESKYVYHCFSCGSKGNLINLICEYQNKFERSGIGYYQILNRILSTDKVMQAELGFRSIYLDDKPDAVDITKAMTPKKFTPPAGEALPSSYCELADLMIKRQATLQQIKLFIILMQSHVDVKEIYGELYNTKCLTDKSGETANLSVSLSDLLYF